MNVNTTDYCRLKKILKNKENWRGVLTTQLKQNIIHGGAEKYNAPWITK